MKTKENYIEPAMEVIEIESEEVIAMSGKGSSLSVDDSGEYDGPAGVKRRIWD